MHMGFEANRPQPIGAHHPYLHDYSQFRETFARPGDDGDAEDATWSEMLDQTMLWQSSSHPDEFEDDDPGGGDVCDEPHDPCDEDGR